MAGLFCVRCGRGFTGGGDRPLCDACLGPGAATRVAAGGGRLFASAGEVPAEWQPGDVLLDMYEVRGLLGEGGMARVYRVWHRGWNIELAVKTPRPEVLVQAGAEAFADEAGTWVDLGLHPHIVTCFYVRSLGGIPRVFAELVPGGSLADWIADRRLYAGTADEVLARLLDVAIQFAWGLGYAHERGLVHQDVKPANVLLTADGVAKVTDFGLSGGRVLEVAGAGAGTTVVRGIGGTPAYSSPEQADALAQAQAGGPGERSWLTRRTDVWSWAVSVLEMFTGERTWQWGQATPAALQDYLTDNPPDQIPPMPQGLASLLSECLAADPADRPHDFGEVAGRLAGLYQEITGEPYPRQAPGQLDLRAESLNNRALSLLDLGQAEQADAAWAEALTQEPFHPESTYNRALTEWRAARTDDIGAVQRLEEVITARPDAWLARYLLAQVHLERGDCQAAIQTLEAVTGPDAGRAEVANALDAARRRLPGSARTWHVFEDHTHSVGSVCLSPDGGHALSGSADNTLKLWDVATGRCVRTFKGHKDLVCSVCLSGDGRYALSGSGDQTLKLWKVATGRCARTFRGHEYTVNSVSLSADSSYALSGSGDGTLKLWEVSTGNCVRTLTGHEGGVFSVYLSPDGRWALSGSGDQTLKLWEVATGTCVRTFAGHEDEIGSVCLSADGRYALSGSGDKTLRLWEVTTGRCVRAFSGHTKHVFSVCLSADGRHALSGGDDGTLRLWEVATGRCVRTFAGHKGGVESVCLSTDERRVLSGGFDSTLKLWQVDLDENGFIAPAWLSRVVAGEAAYKSEAEFRRLLARAGRSRERAGFAEAARLVRQARALPGYGRDREALAAWAALCTCLPRAGLRAGWRLHALAGHKGWVSSVCLSADGRYALSGSLDHTLKLWEVATRRCLRTFEGHQDWVWSVCLSADGRYAMSGGVDRALKLWDVETGRCVRTFAGHGGTVRSVCLSTDSRYALSGSDDGTMRLWKVDTGSCLRTFAGHESGVNSVCLSADGRHALSGGKDSTLKLWDVATGECVRTLSGHDTCTFGVRGVCLSTDGRYALSGGDDRTLKLWEVITGRCVRTFTGHESGVDSVCLSTDGRYALSGSLDSTLKLWQVATGDCVRTFTEHRADVRSVHMSADACYAVSGSEDRTLRFWFLDWELADRGPADWDEGARPYLENFLTLHTPYAAVLPAGREPSEEEIRLALTRRGRPAWTGEDVTGLLSTLGCAGYGWLRPDGVRRKLAELAAGRPPGQAGGGG